MNLDLNNKEPLNIKTLIDFGYEQAKIHFENKLFTFAELWAVTWNDAKEFKGEKVEDWIGAFYAELIQDVRFLIAGRNTWRLREFLTFDEIEKIKNMMFVGEPAPELLEEGFEDFKEEEFEETEVVDEDNEDVISDEDFDVNEEDDVEIEIAETKE